MIHKTNALSNWAINNKATVLVITAIIFLAGINSYKSMPNEAFPEVVMPEIFVTTIYPGNSALDIEKLLQLQLPMQNLEGFDFKMPTAEELKTMKKGMSRTNSPKENHKPKKKKDKPGEAPKWVQSKRSAASKLGRSKHRR